MIDIPQEDQQNTPSLENEDGAFANEIDKVIELEDLSDPTNCHERIGLDN